MFLEPIAVIWDMNGVIIDDMEYHLLAFQAYAKELGHTMTREYFINHAVGASPTQVFSHYLSTIGNPVSVEEATNRKIDLYFEIIHGKMQILPGCRELIEGLYKKGIKQAIASGATRREVDVILKEFELEKYFGASVSCEDVQNGKPDPEPFLTAASRLGVKPARCMVMEDGEFGIRGAKNGGMQAIGVTNTQSREELSGAVLVVDSLEEIKSDTIIKLINSLDIDPSCLVCN